jgi:hypothetical protein
MSEDIRCASCGEARTHSDDCEIWSMMQNYISRDLECGAQWSAPLRDPTCPVCGGTGTDEVVVEFDS